MEIPKIRLGATDLYVTKTAFGCLPVQRVSVEEGAKLLRRAFDSGINYFDTANKYTDSEEKLGLALKGVRHEAIISTKSAGTDKKTVLAHIEHSLRMLQTDYIDLMQLHNPAELPNPEDPDSAYAGLLEARQKGMIRHIGLTNHRYKLALEAIDSGLYETMQFPFCYLSREQEHSVREAAKAHGMGFIAMKGLSGGILNNARACYAFMQQYPEVVPIWGIQREEELDQWLALTAENPGLDEELQAVIEKDRKELSGNFCRSCGYCLPCPAQIDIPQAARMWALLRRSPVMPFMSDEWHEKMHRIDSCLHCYACASRCPYELDTPRLLQENLKDYDEFYARLRG